MEYALGEIVNISVTITGCLVRTQQDGISTPSRVLPLFLLPSTNLVMKDYFRISGNSRRDDLFMISAAQPARTTPAPAPPLARVPGPAEP